MPELLSSAVYDPAAALGSRDSQNSMSPLAQRHTLNTIVENDRNVPSYYFAPRYSPTSTHQAGLISPFSDDFPTPRAHMFNTMRPSPQPSPRYPTAASSYYAQQRESQADSDFDSLYDITDDEAEVPLKCSASVKKVARTRYPSIVIPSPSTWPTIEKLRSAMSSIPPTPSQLLTPSRQGLSSLATHNLQIPATSATPSLDGSMSSEDMDKLSCPSTPDTQNRQSASNVDEWGPVQNRQSVTNIDEWGPVQLDMQALDTLNHLGQSTLEDQHEAQVSQVIETQEVVGEMQEVARPSLGLNIPSSIIQSSSTSNSPLSALSIPSPGGFFSSLQASARRTWMPKTVEDSVPNTSTAEDFYGVPWDKRRNTIAEHIATVTLAGSTLDGYDDAIPTSRPAMLGDIEEGLEVKEINPSKTIFQYNESYNAELEKISAANLERTGHWLEEQDELNAALRDMSSPSLSSGTHSRGSSLDKIVKKSVKFAEEPSKSPTEPESPKKIVTYIQGFEYLQEKSQKNDAFIHRQTRAEAMHLNRRCMPAAHRDQLLGKFELTNPVRPSPPRPVSEFYMDDPTALKERIARAQMERQALDQMLPSTWVLQAQKQLNGGKLLSKPATRVITRSTSPRILDLGGVAVNDWAWQVAYDYSYATVTTVYTAGNNLTANVAGPDNHKHMAVPNLWTLPFPSGHFDVISARSLYELLKTNKPVGRSMDEYDLCLKEAHRCLKPGGFLEFNLLDADLMHAGRQAQAMGVEFGFNLKNRGYDPSPTKSFVPRVHKAGFRNVQRMWKVLPMGKTAANWRDTLPVGAEAKPEERSISPDGQVEFNPSPVFGTTTDAAMMTGLVGSWAWERWMLKLQIEMGKDEEHLLEGVVQVLEEAAKEGSGFRYLTGYARK
ncbi:hypothetical protein BCR34DRAFT_585699 [Clohesyomyces aquaticus]|uniref:Methyltransferase type 11 domain-containing protein n=1 Tax=Clohesyomyces aquaticus TaxID=1231657 RepID=A0A1Y1ZW80_9PLEO|nr:hypothetical protein BCR34DRAFT_585699 [Clohesyomyces aquaticus]